MRVVIPVAWGEMDAYGHVNNAVFLRWLETARIEWFDVVGFPKVLGKVGPVLRTVGVEYLLPVEHPDDIEVTVWPTKLGTSSVTLSYEVRSKRKDALVATGLTVVVLIDFVAGKSLPLPADARARIDACLPQEP